ncbi:MAG: LysM peptidoglycan-binding domain-containing protein [Desulfopila sp.]|jgi:membrane-bound lytic murein transglycosylase D|nr:LysM peptidoglycan-binding domain-containing protein [Desulfopila sp.]
MILSKIRLLLTFSLFLLLSSCAVPKENFLGFLDLYDSTPQEEVLLLDPSNSEMPPSELLPEPVEDETVIAQELDALEKTGSWTDKEVESPVVAEVHDYDFPVVINKQVNMYLDLFQNKQRKHFSRWLARSTAYKPLIEKELEKAGLPKDLVYLAMIESGFNQRAYSRARAVGLWQFMYGTGRDYKLRIDSYVDERRDAEKSTKAAINYLSDLYCRFNNWHLAVAAYNGGPGKIGNGLKKYKTNDFWELAEKKYLHLETKRYVPKLIAAIIIAKNPEKYGFTDLTYAPPLAYDTIEVNPGLSLNALALISGSSQKDIRLLNQELKTDRIPLNQKKYIAKIPQDSYSQAVANLDRLHSVVRTGYKTHIIAQNETLSSICNKYKINKTTLLKVNNLRSGKLLQGQHLRIPYSVVEYQLLPENGTALAQSRDSLILHTIKNGETLSKISTQYGVPEQMIVAWNGLENAHTIRAGNQLALFIVDDTDSVAAAARRPAASNSASPSTAKNNQIVLADIKKTLPQQEGAKRSPFNWYQVKQGDTLWNISQRFNTSPKEIKQLNNLKTNLIHPGNRLRLKDV